MDRGEERKRRNKMTYKELMSCRPFFILHKDPRKQDITVWRKRDNESGLEIYFHGENFWCNPPTDTNMESNAIKKIEKYGVAYLADDYFDGWHKTTWRDAGQYRQQYAKRFFEQLGAKS